jgi:hypothetical protein
MWKCGLLIYSVIAYANATGVVPSHSLPVESMRATPTLAPARPLCLEAILLTASPARRA